MGAERAGMTPEARAAAWRTICFSVAINLAAVIMVTGVMTLTTMAAVAALADLWQAFAPELSVRTGLFWISDVGWFAWTLCVQLTVIVPAVSEVSVVIARAVCGEDGAIGGRKAPGRDAGRNANRLT